MGTFATAALSTVGTLVGGANQRSAARTRAKYAEYEAEQFKLRGEQLKGDRRRELGEALSSIRAIRAATGRAVHSPNADLIAEKRRTDSQRAESRQVLGELMQATALENKASQLRSAGNAAMLAAGFKAATTVSQYLTDAAEKGATGK